MFYQATSPHFALIFFCRTFAKFTGGDIFQLVFGSYTYAEL